MTRIAARIALLFSALAVFVGIASPATADVLPWKWAEKDVCIVSYADETEWPVGEAYNAITPVSPLNLIYADDCTGWQQIITVTAGNWPTQKWVGRTYNDNAGGVITGSRIFLNAAHVPDDWTHANLVTMVAHEIGHGLGLGHTDRPDSLMAPPEDALRHTGPTAYDAAELAALYAPRGITYRPAWKYVP